MRKFIKTLFRTKPVATEEHEQHGLHRCLSAFDLTMLGIGAIIGAGIFVITGIAAATKAGPAVVLSYVLAGVVCGFTALAYAELSSSIGGCGSAYGYTFASMGEFLAWLIGWDLLLEYGLACSTVAIGWSGYVHNALSAIGVNLPHALLKGPFEGGIVDFPAALIVFLITILLATGVKQSAKFNTIIVFVKFIAIALFIGVAMFHFNLANWHPFLPFGWQGVINGAALVFFAFIGFDAVSTAAEEAINPHRDLPIGIIVSLAICTLIYVLVAGLLAGVAHYSTLNVSSPVSNVLLHLGYRFVASMVAVGAVAGLTTVILVMFYGFTRVFLAMTRDRLLPKSLAQVHPKTRTPLRIIAGVGLVMCVIAGTIPIGHIAELVNIGTLAAFAMVCFSTIFLRYSKPNMHRPFKTPLSPLIPLFGFILCLYLMISLPVITWVGFLSWTVIGLVIYFSYSRSRSVLH